MGTIYLTASEWNVLNCLWDACPKTAMQLAAELHESVGWAKSTVMTTLRRMEAKSLVTYEMEGRAKLYSPAVNREDAEASETSSFLNRVYHGSLGLMMSAMARRQALSEEDIAGLRRILSDLEGGEGHDC